MANGDTPGRGEGDVRADRGPTDAAYRRARAALRSGAERAGARAHFRAMGIDPDRLDGPSSASPRRGRGRCRATSPSASSPRTPRGRRGAGGVPLEFNTIAVSDNQTQGTPGMRASLVSREVIADSIELMDHAHDFDALVCLVGCDKTTPAALMALARVDKPAVVLYSGPMRAGQLRGREVTIQDMWEGVGAYERGPHHPRGARRARAPVVPRPGHVRGAVHGQHDGGRARLPRARRPRRRAHPRGRPRRRRRRPPRAPGGSRSSSPGGRTARAFLDRRGLRNAMAGVAATGGSTNGLLHLLAIAREAGVDDDARRARRGGRAHAGDREPRALGALRRRGHAPRGRRARRARAS